MKGASFGNDAGIVTGIVTGIMAYNSEKYNIF